MGQHKIEKMSEKDFSTIKSAAAPPVVMMDTDLEAAMKKRQMKIDSMKEEEFKDVTAAKTTPIKHDNDFEDAMKKRKMKIDPKSEEVSASPMDEAKNIKAVPVQESTARNEQVIMEEEK